MRKPLKQEVSPSEMLYLRESEGLSNKQIAQRIGCSVSSVYAFIGKRSRSVANALAQNKPLPVPESVVTGRYEESVRKEENPMMEQKKAANVEPSDSTFSSFAPTLTVLKERRIIEFKGDGCVFEVDTGEETVSMKDGLVNGLLDKNSLFVFVRELMEIYKLFERQ